MYSDSYIKTHTFSVSEIEHIQKSLEPFLDSSWNQEETLRRIQSICFESFPVEAIEILVTFTGQESSNSVLLLRMPDLIKNLAKTPTQSVYSGTANFSMISEIVHLGLGLLIGEPLGYTAEKDGVLIQHVYPLREERDSPSNESSSTNLSLHTEMVYTPSLPDSDFNKACPDFVSLLCLREDRRKEAVTVLADVTKVCNMLSNHSLKILRSPRFEHRIPYSFSNNSINTDRPWVGPFAILKENGKFFNAAFDLACGTRGLDAEAENALLEFKEFANRADLFEHVTLEPGDNLIINNKRCAHGRTSFYAAFDGTDRWLQRLYIRRTLENLRPINPPISPRIF